MYEIAKNGGESVLYSFQGGDDGWGPEGALFEDALGDLYGSTNVGGNGAICEYGCGTVFKFATDGTEAVLYAFQGRSDGQFPQGSLIADKSGNLYGVTEEGGNYSGECAQNDDGCGTVFKLAPGGTETVLYAFQGGTDGESPQGGLIADNAGNLYGTTNDGGTSTQGTVFKVSPSGQETVLYSFGGGSDGSEPQAPLVMDNKGNLYGTTYYGGGTGCKSQGSGCGTVFEITPDGKEKILRAFGGHFGKHPTAGLLLGKHGDLYGTTSLGGGDMDGVAFELKK